jgi:predicted ATPase
MAFIKTFSVETARKNPFPFNVPAILFARNISMDSELVIFTGDNGCGKSTLLESLALKLGLPLISGNIGDHPGFEAARLIKPFITIEWKLQISRGFFFRAEDFSGAINSLENEKQKKNRDLPALTGQVDDPIINTPDESMNYSLQQMKKNYGDNMQAYSHGEACLKILQTRIGDKGVYLLDEPEAALSPVKQMALIFFIREVLKKGNAQFIISTHSPIIMGIPGALIYEILEDRMHVVKYEETDHYQITRTFLTNPEFYLKHL